MFIRGETRRQLRQYFAKRLVHPVQLVVFGQTVQTNEDPLPIQHELCSDAKQLMQEMAEISEHITVLAHDVFHDHSATLRYAVDKVPAIAILGPAGDQGIRFYGVPANYEFVTFMEVITLVSAQTPELSETSLRALGNLGPEVHIQVFHTPTCALCPAMSHLGHRFAMASPRIRCDSVDAAEFPQLARRYRVKGAPHVVINETSHLMGLKTEREFLNAVLRAAARPCPVLAA